TVSRNAADFYTLKDFIEFTRELLPTFRLRKRDNGYVASMGDDAMHEFMEQQPAIFLDGVYIHDVNQISAYGSEKLKRIELINARYAYGDILFPGILAVFTKKGEINNIIPTPTTIRTRLVAFQPCEGLAVTHPLGGQDHQPDFRQILYWNPDIEISGKHTQVPGFYASDHTGYYIISVEGISSDGIPISALTKIKINQ